MTLQTRDWIARHPLKFAALAHLLLAAFLFSPFFLQGKVLVASTDNFFHMFPNLFFIASALQQGDLGLWNPNILCGLDFTTSTHNFLLAPLNWPLYFLSPDLFLLGFTIRVLLEVWMVGFFAFLFFREELSSNTWGFWTAIVYQMGGYTIFSMTTYANTQIYLFNIISLYLLWTLPRRKPWKSLLFLSLCLSGVIFCGNITYAFASFLLIFLCFLYRFWSARPAPWRGGDHNLVFYGAFVVALLLTAPRWVPVCQSLFFEGTRMAGVQLANNGGRSFQILRLFLPEAFGVTMAQSFPFFHALYKDDGGHLQFHSIDYFGLAAVFFMLLGLLSRSPKARFWQILGLLALAWMLVWPPLAGILDLLFYPLLHTIVPKMLIPVCFCAMAGHGVKEFEAAGKPLSPSGRKILLAVMAGVLALTATVFAFTFPTAIMTSKGVLLAGWAAFLGVARLLRASDAPSRGWWIPWFAAAFALAGLILYCHRQDLFQHRIFIFNFTSLLASGLFLLLLLGLSAGFLERRLPARYWLLSSLGLLLVLFLGLCLIKNDSSNDYAMPGQFIITLLGTVNFLILGFGLLAWLSRFGRDLRITQALFPGLVLLLLFDLLPYNKAHWRLITEPFQEAGTIYPNRDFLFKTSTTPNSRNLLANASFEKWREDSTRDALDWVVGGKDYVVSLNHPDRVMGKTSLSLSNPSAEDVNLYQDVPLKPGPARRMFTFGAWIKSNRPGTARLFLTDQKTGSGFSPCQVAGKWQWLTVSLPSWKNAKSLRATVNFLPHAETLIDGAILVEGYEASPLLRMPKESDENQLIPGFTGMVTEPLRIDRNNYRVNRPHVALGLRDPRIEELMANIASIYNLRMYAGVNSDLPDNLISLIKHFIPEFKGSSQFAPDLQPPRLLDLLGCGYDVDASGGLQERKTALSRFMLFHDFAVEPDRGRLLDRLRDEDFVVRGKLFLETPPGETPAEPGTAAETLPYESQGTSHLTVQVSTPRPALLYFGDSFHRDWRAEINGQEQRVLKSNYHFLAVPVPAGKYQVVFRFVPRLFFRSFIATGIGLVLLVLLGLILSGRPQTGCALDAWRPDVPGKPG